MRMNGPVTNQEYILPDEEVIITHTDPSSRITYANSAFLSSSGFTLDECLGQTHNMVRHPDMPVEAFADLWKTIRQGKSWTGMVKNRRKDGGFYWVRANVTPMKSRGEVSGYMSVRTKPTRDEVREAERLYAALRAGRAGSVRLKEGRIYDTSFAAMLGRAMKPSLRTGTWIFIGFLSVLMAVMGIGSWMSRGFDWFAAGSLLGCVIAMSNMFYVQSRVVRPLQRLHTAAFQLISGDTSTRIDAQGASCVVQLARGLEQLRCKLDGVLKDNLSAASQVRSGVTSVVSASADLSNRTNETAASLEETAASLEELMATVQRNTENAQQAAQLARSSSKATTQGRDVVSEMFETMKAISESSNRINDIVTLIDGIAFQTNLLALNAAVEAARAGDQGRGFAVVAQEVRSLAQRSAASAKEIKDLIESSRETVMRGSELAGRAEESMNEVVQSVKRVVDVIGEIETASREQSMGIEQINRAMTQMDTITQQDAQMAQALIGTASQLDDESLQMVAAISAFAMVQPPARHHAPVSVSHRSVEVPVDRAA